MDDEQRAEYRKSLCDNRDSSQDSYDKAVLTIAAGALALALGFVKPGGPVVVAKWLIWTACGCFMASLLTVILSYRLSFYGFTKQIRVVDDADANRVHQERAGGRYAWWTECLNWTSFGALVVGIATLATFVIRNL